MQQQANERPAKEGEVRLGLMVALTAAIGASESVAQGPTLAETREWLNTEVARFSGLSYVTRGEPRMTGSWRVTQVVADSCTLYFKTTNDFVPVTALPPVVKQNWVPVGDLDLASLVVGEPTVAQLARPEERARLFAVKGTTQGGANAIRAQADGEELPDASAFEMPFGKIEDAQRVLRAITRFAELCGAKRSAF